MLCLLAAALTGCSTGVSSVSVDDRQVAMWVHRQGGLADSAHTQPVRQACDVLRPVAGELIVHVLDRDTVGAYAWPDGRIYLTRGLIDVMDRRELIAVIAHELGHLIDDGHLTRPAALGGELSLRRESRADRVGLGMLEACGVSGEVMGRMLAKLADAEGLSPAARQLVRRRIGLLSRTAH